MLGAHSTFAIGGVSCSADSLVIADSFMLRVNISDEKPAHRKSANRWQQHRWTDLTYELNEKNNILPLDTFINKLIVPTGQQRILST